MNDDKLPYEGGCLCGAVRYRAVSPPIRAVICHCPMCRRHSGAPRTQAKSSTRKCTKASAGAPECLRHIGQWQITARIGGETAR